MKKKRITIFTVIAVLGALASISGCASQSKNEATTTDVSEQVTQASQEKTLDEAGLLNAFTAKAGTDYIYFLPADYDGDGTLEAFGITGTSGGDLHDDVDIWFVSSAGECTLAKSDTFGLLKETITVDNGSFITWCATAGGSSSTDYVFGCKDGELFEPEVSGKYAGFGDRTMDYSFSDVNYFDTLNCNYIGYHDYLSDYNGHIWDPIAFDYDEKTREFVQIGFEQSGTFICSEYESSNTYSLIANNQHIYQNSNGIYINGKQIDSNADPSFISDGYTIYYNSNGNIIRVDLDTLAKETVLYDDEAFLKGCFDNQYLYYSTSKYNNDEIQLDLAVYNLGSGSVVNVISNVGYVAVGDKHIYALAQAGEIDDVSIRQADLDGSNCTQIIDNASPTAMTADGSKLYYGAMNYYSGLQYTLQIQSYDENTGEIAVLTDAYDDNMYVKKITSKYASITNGISEPFYVSYK